VRRFVGVAVAAAVVAGPACSRAGEPPDPTPSRCDVGLAVPDGFRVTGTMEDPYPDRIGVRLDLRADGGRELHYFAGIPGEFGEGLPGRGWIDVRGGETGKLAGADTTWVLAWGSGTPCTPVVVLGNGMERRAFMDLLANAGALPDGSNS
jgi:hypothetical protein